MSFKMLIKGAGAAFAVLTFSVGAATAQPICDTEEFGSENGELYLAAENELTINDNPAAALVALNKLRAQSLNCYEEGAALQLSAAIKLQTDDYLGAAEDMKLSIARGYVQGQARTDLLKSLSQIYFAEDQYAEGLNYINQWMNEGGVPNRDEKWTIAVVNFQLERFQDSLPWAEEVYAIDGSNANKTVTDFLLLLYDRTNQPAKKSALLEELLERDPSNRTYWDAISGGYYQADDERKAFEVQKAMYLGGILTTEDELNRIVQFYNRFDVPYHAARILEKEINAGRISKTYKNLELLANLYQVAREHEKAIPVIREAAALNNNGQMYERLGRSYADLQRWEEAEQALTQALNAGGLKDSGLAWVQIGQSRYERGDRPGAREAFRSARNRGGRGWIAFMDSEERTAKALRIFEAATVRQELENEQKACDQLSVLGDDGLPEGCTTVAVRLEEAEAELARVQAS